MPVAPSPRDPDIDNSLCPDADAPPAGASACEPKCRTAHWHPGLRFLLLNAGLLLYGFGLAAMINANVGLAPWDAFHVGLTHHLPFLTVGNASILAGLVCQASAYFFLGMPVGVGSVLNMILIGVYTDLLRPVIPHSHTSLAAWSWFLGGILITGLATGTYIASQFGAGPRDSVALGLARRTTWPIKYVRTGMELTVLAAGWLLGAKVGWGTLVFALLFGPAMSASLALYGLRR